VSLGCKAGRTRAFVRKTIRVVRMLPFCNRELHSVRGVDQPRRDERIANGTQSAAVFLIRAKRQIGFACTVGDHAGDAWRRARCENWSAPGIGGVDVVDAGRLQPD